MDRDSSRLKIMLRRWGSLGCAAFFVAAAWGSPAQQPAPSIRHDRYPIPLAPGVPDDPAGSEVKQLESGLRYCVLQSASDAARTPRTGDFVTVHFTAWTENGRLYDSSVLRNEPLKLWVGKSIAGWNEVLALMSKGARWKVTLPASLCTGAEDARPSVPAATAMIFEIELLDILAVPTFHPARPDVTQTTPGGLKYEVLQPGVGTEPPDKHRILVVDYGLWTTSGTLLDSAARQGAMFEIKPAQFDIFWELKFMKEAFSLLRPGARLRFEVPPEQCYGMHENPGLPANSTTVWEFELVQVRAPRELPAFAPPDEKKSHTTDTGLVYEVVREGTGDKPAAGSKVSANYAIWLVTGSVFDASFEGGTPARLDLADPGLLPGIREALLSMSEGSILRCRVKPDLAYGARGWPPYIGPNAELIVYLELVSAS